MHKVRLVVKRKEGLAAPDNLGRIKRSLGIGEVDIHAFPQIRVRGKGFPEKGHRIKHRPTLPGAQVGDPGINQNADSVNVVKRERRREIIRKGHDLAAKERWQNTGAVIGADREQTVILEQASGVDSGHFRQEHFFGIIKYLLKIKSRPLRRMKVHHERQVRDGFVTPAGGVQLFYRAEMRTVNRRLHFFKIMSGFGTHDYFSKYLPYSLNAAPNHTKLFCLYSSR